MRTATVPWPDVEAKIFDNILANYSWPAEIFSGSQERIFALEELLTLTSA